MEDKETSGTYTGVDISNGIPRQVTLNRNTTTTYSTMHHYTIPELIDYIVTPTSIELVFKRQLMVSSYNGMPNPEVFKIIYSRHDGSEKTIFGTFVPASSESYEFE
jgi:hypothetical protein